MTGSYNHPILGEVTISQSARAKRISISVRPSGNIRLSFPRYVSAKRALAFLDSKIEWIVAARQRMEQKNMQRPKFSAEEIEQLRIRAKEILPRKVEQMAAKFGFQYGRVTVRAARSKWGSCSAENNISLSLWLMTLPEHLIDYVVIHELCHTVHHNHSARFHALADKCLGGREKELRRELHRYSTGVAAE